MPNGYLGVDIFFVISGYLITSLIYKELKNKSFSIWKFYERRIRRIIPLLLFITTISLCVGFFIMLPDDLENLAQSVIASNFSANNILMLLTSADYWSVDNNYKPLTHTWSLGIEEQYYLIYPILLLLVSKIHSRLIFYFLILASLISIVLFLFYGNPASRFYLLQYRFFELSLGGLSAIAFFGKNHFNFSNKLFFNLSALGLLMIVVKQDLNNKVLVVATTFLTLVFLTTGGMGGKESYISKKLFQNSIVVYIGKISFSLYMWHQLVFAFSRYAFYEKITYANSFLLVVITFLLSIVTYHFIENPFRNKNLFLTKKVFTILGISFLLSTSFAFYLYSIGGVYKDFYEIGVTTEDIEKQGYNLFSSQDNIHIRYNEKVRELDKPFGILTKTNVLVIGNSYGRDVANIFLENGVNQIIELRYFDISRAKTDKNIIKRWENADVIIFAAETFLSKKWILEIGHIFNFQIDLEYIYMFGTKDFGYSNGIHYNMMSSISDFSNYYANMRDGTLENEKKLQTEWGNKYISLISPLINDKRKIRILDDEGRFLSQDTRHLSKAGAMFYANTLDKILKIILKV